MGQNAGMMNRIAVVGIVALGISAQALGEVRPEVVQRIAPIGTVEVAGQAGSAPAPAAEAAKAPEPATSPEAEAAPAAAAAPAEVPAAAPAAAPAGGDGSALYAAKGCAACHGPDGRKTALKDYPKIAGQGVQYLVAQMKDIKSGARSNGQTMVMKGVIAQVSDAEMQTIAEWLSSL